ncbi:MAG: NAD(P)/FAD-dependent oxidoreductase [Vicinamibacteria bacterium]|nr:NAD(P)/FAD-dependent oxidoreductase [Vicinamibacteria bacterium]
MKHVVVIGAGPAGLKAASTLGRRGVRVTVLERESALGGLAGSFDLQGVRIERYYHFICKGDDDLVETVEQLGLSERLHWRSSRMAYFVDGRLYPFLTPWELLRFRPLSLADRVRAGIAVQRARRMREEDLARRRAMEWLRDLFGETACRIIWEPLMRFKFAEYAPEISAAWIWARMIRLSRSRKSPWREDLGYLDGGSRTVFEALQRDIEKHGGCVRLGTPVEAALIEGERVTGVRAGGETLAADAVISTVTPVVLLRAAPDLRGEYFERLRRIPTIGIFCLFLRLRRSVTPYFWVNASDARVPFAGMIEYTNLNPMHALAGDRVLYVPQYLSASDPRFSQDDEEVLRSYTDALALIHPAFDRDWIRHWAVFRDRFAQPICLTDYRETTPAIESPVPNLFLTDSCQLHPHDRTISGSLSLGRRAAELAAARIERPVER